MIWWRGYLPHGDFLPSPETVYLVLWSSDVLVLRYSERGLVYRVPGNKGSRVQRDGPPFHEHRRSGEELRGMGSAGCYS